MNNKFTYEQLVERLDALENAEAEREKAVSERAYFEKQSQILLDNSPVCTKIVDLDYNLQYMSRAGIEALDVDDVTKLYGEPFPLKFYPEPSKQRMLKNLEKAKETGAVISFETDLIKSNGEEIWFHSTLVPVKDDDGNVDYIMVVSADTTERRLGEDNLKKAHEEMLASRNALEKETAAAKAANFAKSEFLASMSHELRTPMNAVLGFAQMLQFDPRHDLNDHQNEYVENILQGGGHLLELINDVLDLSKIEARQLSLSIEDVICNEVIEDVVGMTAPLANKKDIEVIDNFSAQAAVTILADRIRYKQCLFNLLSNAVKYNKESGKIIIEGKKTDDGYLTISIEDTGIGIGKEDYENVFHMFHRVEGNPNIANEGTGIGLTVTKMLIEQMDGRIGFKSEKDRGSTFWIELPLGNNS